MDNHWWKKQAITNQGGSKKLPFSYENVINSAVRESQSLGKTGRYGQMRSQASCSNFMVEFQDVICHAQDSPFGVYLDVPPEKKASEIHILFRHRERAFGLYTTVNPKEFPNGSIDHDVHSLTLLCKPLGDVQSFAAFFHRNFALALDAFFFQWAALTFGALVHRCFYGKTCRGLRFSDMVKFQTFAVCA